MKIKLDKMKFNSIETAFTVLKQDPTSRTSCVIISKALKACFDCDFFVLVVTPKKEDSPLFVMSVYPQLGTVSKIVDALGSEKELDAITNLWKENNSWVVEIDSRILYNGKDGIFGEAPTEKELTAALMHEIGHIVSSNSIPARIATIMRYEIAKSPIITKAMMRDNVFKPLMALPVLDSCTVGTPANKKALREEIKADTFAKKMGYKNDLISFLDKLSAYATKAGKNTNKNDDMRKMTQFVISNYDDFNARKNNLTRGELTNIKENCDSPYIEKIISEYIESVYNDSLISSAMFEGRKLEIMHERADRDVSEYFSEFVILPGRKLKRIDPAELDYIVIKMNSMSNESDRMLLVSYIHNKLDIIDYYISILQDENMSRKYSVPHSLAQLNNMRARLLDAREKILSYHIPERDRHVLVKWPTGYEA